MRFTWRSITTLAVMLAAVACNDPTAVTSQSRERPVVRLPERTFDLQAGGPPNYGVPGFPSTGTHAEAAREQCLTNLDAYGTTVSSLDQGENLVWNSPRWTTANAPYGVPHDTLFKGRVKVVYKYWYGTYNLWGGGVPLRCIKLVADSLFRAAKQSPNAVTTGNFTVVKLFGTSLREVQPSGGVSWCAGYSANPVPGGATACDTPDAASLVYNAELRYTRKCDITEDSWDGENSYEEIVWDGSTNAGAWLSGVYSLGGVTPQSMKWSYKMYAVTPSGQWFTPGMAGWWTTLDYGGGVSPYTNGVRDQWTYGGLTLCNRYSWNMHYANSLWYDVHLGGRADWHGPYWTAGSAWPGADWP